jgi:putative DNA primase/helicase
MTEGGDEEEWRKRITSALRKQSAFLLLDNVQKRIDSSALASALTSTMWTDRILGQSNIESVEICCGWMATGNNPTVSSEIARRTVRIRLDAKTEKPWLRAAEQFKNPNLLRWAEVNRGALIWAALVLVQNWVYRGRPKPGSGINLGMFEEWSAVVGGILESADIEGFMGNLHELYECTDDEDPALKRFVRQWWEIHNSRPVKVFELFELLRDLDFPFDIGGGDTERGQKIALGKYLQRLRDRQISEFRIVAGKLTHNTRTWKLELSPPTTRGDGEAILMGEALKHPPNPPMKILK